MSELRLLLDTNVFITGFLEPDSDEAMLLTILAERSNIILLYSKDLDEQIRRVGKRLQHSNWVGLLLHYIWSNYRIVYIDLSTEQLSETETLTDIPREDVGIYLTAIQGQADYLISANRELLRQAMANQALFRCLTAREFISQHLVD